MHARITVLIGTRPGIVKMAPLIKELSARNASYNVIHTGQHYSEQMDRAIMNAVGLESPDFQLVRPRNCTSHAQQTAYMLVEIEKVLVDQQPEILLVCGDANTNLAGALAARKLRIAVGHVESGLRSFDWRMPEEHNRVMIDHISEFLFAVNSIGRRHLESDGVRGRILTVGNTIVDATRQNVARAKEQYGDLHLELTHGEPYAVLTTHREENVDYKDRLIQMITGLEQIRPQFCSHFVFPMHPRTAKRLSQFGLRERLEQIPYVHVVEPMDYMEFLALLIDCSVVLTDSGGIQEESCILGKPCITLRDSTERQETVLIGANRLAGTDARGIVEAYEEFEARPIETRRWDNPYGDGEAASRIIDTCLLGRPSDEFQWDHVNWRDCMPGGHSHVPQTMQQVA